MLKLEHVVSMAENELLELRNDLKSNQTAQSILPLRNNNNEVLRTKKVVSTISLIDTSSDDDYLRTITERTEGDPSKDSPNPNVIRSSSISCFPNMCYNNFAGVCNRPSPYTATSQCKVSAHPSRCGQVCPPPAGHVCPQSVGQVCPPPVKICKPFSCNTSFNQEKKPFSCNTSFEYSRQYDCRQERSPQPKLTPVQPDVVEEPPKPTPPRKQTGRPLVTPKVSPPKKFPSKTVPSPKPKPPPQKPTFPVKSKPSVKESKTHAPPKPIIATPNPQPPRSPKQQPSPKPPKPPPLPPPAKQPHPPPPSPKQPQPPPPPKQSQPPPPPKQPQPPPPPKQPQPPPPSKQPPPKPPKPPPLPKQTPPPPKQPPPPPKQPSAKVPKPPLSSKQQPPQPQSKPPKKSNQPPKQTSFQPPKETSAKPPKPASQSSKPPLKPSLQSKQPPKQPKTPPPSPKRQKIPPKRSQTPPPRKPDSPKPKYESRPTSPTSPTSPPYEEELEVENLTLPPKVYCTPPTRCGGPPCGLTRCPGTRKTGPTPMKTTRCTANKIVFTPTCKPNCVSPRISAKNSISSPSNKVICSRSKKSAVSSVVSCGSHRQKNNHRQGELIQCDQQQPAVNINYAFSNKTGYIHRKENSHLEQMTKPRSGKSTPRRNSINAPKYIQKHAPKVYHATPGKMCPGQELSDYEMEDSHSPGCINCTPPSLSCSLSPGDPRLEQALPKSVLKPQCGCCNTNLPNVQYPPKFKLNYHCNKYPYCCYESGEYSKQFRKERSLPDGCFKSRDTSPITCVHTLNESSSEVSCNIFTSNEDSVKFKRNHVVKQSKIEVYISNSSDSKYPALNNIDTSTNTPDNIDSYLYLPYTFNPCHLSTKQFKCPTKCSDFGSETSKDLANERKKEIIQRCKIQQLPGVSIEKSLIQERVLNLDVKNIDFCRPCCNNNACYNNQPKSRGCPNQPNLKYACHVDDGCKCGIPIRPMPCNFTPMDWTEDKSQQLSFSNCNMPKAKSYSCFNSCCKLEEPKRTVSECICTEATAGQNAAQQTNVCTTNVGSSPRSQQCSDIGIQHRPGGRVMETSVTVNIPPEHDDETFPIFQKNDLASNTDLPSQQRKTTSTSGFKIQPDDDMTPTRQSRKDVLSLSSRSIKSHRSGKEKSLSRRSIKDRQSPVRQSIKDWPGPTRRSTKDPRQSTRQSARQSTRQSTNRRSIKHSPIRRSVKGNKTSMHAMIPNSPADEDDDEEMDNLGTPDSKPEKGSACEMGGSCGKGMNPTETASTHFDDTVSTDSRHQRGKYGDNSSLKGKYGENSSLKGKYGENSSLKGKYGETSSLKGKYGESYDQRGQDRQRGEDNYNQEKKCQDNCYASKGHVIACPIQNKSAGRKEEYPRKELLQEQCTQKEGTCEFSNQKNTGQDTFQIRQREQDQPKQTCAEAQCYTPKRTSACRQKQQAECVQTAPVQSCSGRRISFHENQVKSTQNTCEPQTQVACVQKTPCPSPRRSCCKKPSCQDGCKPKRSCQNICKKKRSCQNICKPKRSCQSVCKPKRSCQNVCKPKPSCEKIHTPIPTTGLEYCKYSSTTQRGRSPRPISSSKSSRSRSSCCKKKGPCGSETCNSRSPSSERKICFKSSKSTCSSMDQRRGTQSKTCVCNKQSKTTCNPCCCCIPPRRKKSRCSSKKRGCSCCRSHKCTNYACQGECRRNAETPENKGCCSCMRKKKKRPCATVVQCPAIPSKPITCECKKTSKPCTQPLCMATYRKNIEVGHCIINTPKKDNEFLDLQHTEDLYVLVHDASAQAVLLNNDEVLNLSPTPSILEYLALKNSDTSINDLLNLDNYIKPKDKSVKAEKEIKLSEEETKCSKEIIIHSNSPEINLEELSIERVKNDGTKNPFEETKFEDPRSETNPKRTDIPTKSSDRNNPWHTPEITNVLNLESEITDIMPPRNRNHKLDAIEPNNSNNVSKTSKFSWKSLRQRNFLRGSGLPKLKDVKDHLKTVSSSDGEADCKCSVSIGEIHNCPISERSKNGIKKPDSGLQIAGRHRHFFNKNLVSYYISTSSSVNEL